MLSDVWRARKGPLSGRNGIQLHFPPSHFFCFHLKRGKVLTFRALAGSSWRVSLVVTRVQGGVEEAVATSVVDSENEENGHPTAI